MNNLLPFFIRLWRHETPKYMIFLFFQGPNSHKSNFLFLKIAPFISSHSFDIRSLSLVNLQQCKELHSERNIMIVFCVLRRYKRILSYFMPVYFISFYLEEARGWFFHISSMKTSMTYSDLINVNKMYCGRQTMFVFPTSILIHRKTINI